MLTKIKGGIYMCIVCVCLFIYSFIHKLKSIAVKEIWNQYDQNGENGIGESSSSCPFVVSFM